MVVQIVLDDLYPPPADDADVIARRIFSLSISDRHDELVTAGVPVVRWSNDSHLGGIVTASRGCTGMPWCTGERASLRASEPA